MFGLFGNIRFVRLQFEQVATPSEFVGGMILHIDAAKLCGAVIST